MAANMTASALGEASARLTRAGLVPLRGVSSRLLDPADVDAVLAAAAIEPTRGLLTVALFEDLLAQGRELAGATAPAYVEPEISGALARTPTGGDHPTGRTIAPLEAAPTEAPLRPHGLADVDLSRFPMAANDAAVDLSVTFDITGNSTTEATMQDIQGFFVARIANIRRQLERGGALPRRITPILDVLRQRSKYRSGEGTEATICGLISDPRSTKNGHFTFVIEDETAEVRCMVAMRNSSDSGVPHEIARIGLMPDDVVGVSGLLNRSGDLLYVDDIHFPPLPRRQRTHAEQGVSVAFLSDIHVGSKTFLEAQWHKMSKWFREDPLARTIKYLILSGDVVDGIGIYPGQEQELAIPDLWDQYSHLAALLDDLPDWVEVVLLPGNHDAVRPAEPQPALDPEVQQDFNQTTFVGNPCDFSLHGVKLLSYHGKSIDDFVSGLRNVTYAEPIVAMKEMLRRRHLAPSWGGKTPLSPEAEDHLVIREVPDIFVTGHVHGHHCEDHRGTTLVCSSTWQDQTSYQRMLGFQPKPCILTVVNLGTHATASIPFA